MVIQDIYDAHIEKYLELKRDCDNLLRLGIDGINMCFEKIKDYLNDYAIKDEKAMLITLEARYSKFVQDKKIGAFSSREEENKEFNHLNWGILDFISSSLLPNGLMDYGKNSLRKNSRWDERDNLIAFIYFFKEQEVERAFNKMLKDKRLIKKIKIERYYIMDGQKIILLDDMPHFEDLNEFGEIEDSDRDVIIINNKKYSIETRNLIDFDSVRYENRDPEGFLISEVIVEKKTRKSQIWISAIGDLEEKCKFFKEIIDYIIGVVDIEDYAICIPQGIDFYTDKHSDSEILISLKQSI